jgi:hypothetical protein
VRCGNRIQRRRPRHTENLALFRRGRGRRFPTDRASATKTKLAARHVVANRSFETRLRLDSADRFAAVDALDARGRVLGRSTAVRY